MRRSERGSTGRREVGRRLTARSEDEIVRAVRAAREARLRLRVAGAGGSKSDVNAPADVALHLDLADGVTPEVSGRAVTVSADLTAGRLHELLRERELALPTVGEWKNATVAGSLATATHGGSARHGIMATSVRRLRLVDGRGEVVELSASDPDFCHAAVSLGAFGVITAVTLGCEEQFHLRIHTDVVSFDDYLRDPVAQESRSEFHASVWMTSARRVVRFAADRTQVRERPVPRRERFGRRTTLATLLSRRLGYHGPLFARLFRHTAVGESGEILTPLEVPSRVARFRNAANTLRRRAATELAVPASTAAQTLALFDDLFRRRPKPLNNPIGLRVNPADRFSVSPCAGRDTLWLDIFYDEVEPFMSELAELAAQVGARCHWGKALVPAPEVLRASYPAWDAFREARARFDPDEVFANRFTDALGLTGGGRPG